MKHMQNLTTYLWILPKYENINDQEPKGISGKYVFSHSEWIHYKVMYLTKIASCQTFYTISKLLKRWQRCNLWLSHIEMILLLEGDKVQRNVGKILTSNVFWNKIFLVAWFPLAVTLFSNLAENMEFCGTKVAQRNTEGNLFYWSLFGWHSSSLYHWLYATDFCSVFLQMSRQGQKEECFILWWRDRQFLSLRSMIESYPMYLKLYVSLG